MPVFSVSYDLLAPGKNYQPLYDELARLNAKRLLLSQWGVRMTAGTTAVALRDHLKAYIDSNDRLLIIQFDGTEWASWNSMYDINKL